MLNQITTENKDDAIFHPEHYFNDPQDILNEKNLKNKEKELALLQWMIDIKLEQIAEEENMIRTGHSQDVLDKIESALRIIRKKLPDSNLHPTATKLGEL